MGTLDYNKDFYSKVSSENKEVLEYRKLQSAKMERCLGLFDEYKCGKVLDIGCFDGFFTGLVGEKTGAELYGVELSETAAAKARKRGIKVEVANIDGTRLPFKSEFFDAVFCSEVIEHIFETENLLKEIKRVLKPDGYLVMTVPNTGAWYNRLFLMFGYLPTHVEASSNTYTGNPFMTEGAGHIRAFTKRALLELLKLTGFKVRKTRGFPLVMTLPNKTTEAMANKIDRIFSRSSSLASGVIVKAFK